VPYHLFASQWSQEGAGDYPVIVSFFMFNKSEGEAIDRQILEIEPDLRDESLRVRRFARFSERCFRRAAERLCQLYQARDPPTGPQAISVHWHVGEDVFREWIRTAVFPGDHEAYMAATEYARYFNAALSSALWQTEQTQSSNRHTTIQIPADMIRRLIPGDRCRPQRNRCVTPTSECHVLRQSYIRHTQHETLAMIRNGCCAR
jgi:hypothetical protein